MADISIIQSNVVDHQAGLTTAPVQINSSLKAGVALAPGDFVYSDTSSLWQLLQCAVSGAVALSGVGAAIGVVVNTSAAGQPVSVQTGGPITIGGNPVPAIGTVLYGSINAGKIATAVITNQYVTVAGTVISATDINLQPNATNLVHG